MQICCGYTLHGCMRAFVHARGRGSNSSDASPVYWGESKGAEVKGVARVVVDLHCICGRPLAGGQNLAGFLTHLRPQRYSFQTCKNYDVQQRIVLSDNSIYAPEEAWGHHLGSGRDNVIHKLH